MTIYLFGYYLLLFAGGLALLFMTYRRYQRTSDPLLLSYTYYLLAVNATVFDSGVGEAFLSLTSSIRLLPGASIETFSKILCLLSVPLLFIGWYLFLRLISKLMGHDINRMVWIVYLAAQLLAAAAFAIMVANFASTPDPTSSRAYTTAFMAVRWLGGFIRFWALAQIVFYIGNVRDAWWRKSVLRFGGMYAGLLAVHYGLLLLPPPRAIFVLIYPIAYFISDYVPLIYLLVVLSKEFRGIPAVSSTGVVLDGLAGVSELTKREREIVGLILAGKDNIDIHRALFISAGTVRNHVSNIYRKLGLKNRYQLLALARKDVGIDGQYRFNAARGLSPEGSLPRPHITKG
jgi:DNA-binding CsgD family transcriptional regulator